eukprot:s907_g8.t1
MDISPDRFSEEFVIFDADQVYVEYALFYRRKSVTAYVSRIARGDPIGLGWMFLHAGLPLAEMLRNVSPLSL